VSRPLTATGSTTASDQLTFTVVAPTYDLDLTAATTTGGALAWVSTSDLDFAGTVTAPGTTGFAGSSRDVTFAATTLTSGTFTFTAAAGARIKAAQRIPGLWQAERI
jgi:hypothetical protein